jgi:ABC-type transport system involved in multi-copper enzyme maturation permease subunit
MSWRRVRAIVVKELREYRHNGNIIYAMAVIPLVFVIQPIVEVFALKSSAAPTLRHEDSLLYMLAIPALTPAMLSSYGVVGERDQGTLEPLLATPIQARELLLGKALSAFVPSLIVAYTVFAVFIAVVEIFAPSTVVAALIRGPEVVDQVVFTPLLAGISIWIGMIISARSRDVRVAAQLSALASLPLVAVTSLIAFGVIDATTKLAVGCAVALFVLNRLGLRVASAVFDRERLVTGSR